MLSSVQYTLNTKSFTDNVINADVTYEVYFDVTKAIAYDVVLKVPVEEGSSDMEIAWQAKIVNDVGEKRLEYDYLKMIYYETKQTIKVERALYYLQEDLMKFLGSEKVQPVEEISVGDRTYPGYSLYTLTIWYDPENHVPIRRINRDRGNIIIDNFTYDSINGNIPESVFELPKPEEAIANFDLYPEAPTLPRFECVTEDPQYGIYVTTLVEEIKRHVILNQWEYGPFSTIKLPWLTTLPVSIYRRKLEETFPPLIAVVDVPMQGRSYFFITYDFLGYVVSGYTDSEYDLSAYEELPISASMMLVDFVPLYQSPSFEKNFVVNNFIFSIQSNDFFITAFDMGDKDFDMIIKNFSFHENEGYYLLNVYGKEYWDSVNMEAMFNFVISGQLADAHTTPIIIYQINTIKRMGIYREVTMPKYEEIPASPETFEGITVL